MRGAQTLDQLGRLPLVGGLLRTWARGYREGSVSTIRAGCAKGMKWKRYHRFVSAYWAGTYELPLQEAIGRLLRPGQVFHDLGANAGFFSLVAARAVGPAGFVVAFEPDPGNAERAAEQFRVNGLAYCRIVAMAVGKQAGTLGFRYGNHSATGKLVGEGPGHLCDLTVPVVSLDEFVENGNPVPHVIKIDVEGAEADVLRGAARLLRGNAPPQLLIEVHEGHSAEVKQLLADSVYACYDLAGAPLGALPEGGHILAAAVRGGRVGRA